MKAYLVGTALICSIFAFASCSTTQTRTILDPVGPRPPGAQMGPATGDLKVYSATEEHIDGEVPYYPHTNYEIQKSDGTLFRRVRNHIGSNDEDPETVSLPIGEYKVVARSEKDGTIVIPVIIKSGKITILNLEEGRESDRQAIDPSFAVKTPSGQVVGWRAKK